MYLMDAGLLYSSFFSAFASFPFYYLYPLFVELKGVLYVKNIYKF